MQGDQVLVELAPPRADGRRLGRIARILERRNPTVVGIFHYARSDRELGDNVVPFDERMTQPIVIPFGQELPQADEPATPHRVLGSEAASPTHYDNLEGIVVDVEITSWPTPTRPPIGRIIEVLGDPDDFGVDVEMMIRKHQLPRVFPDNVLAEARAVAFLDDVEVNRRRDFRGLPIVTIDGETARISTMPSSSPNAPMADTSSRSISPTSPSMSAQALISISKRASAEPASTFPTAPFPMLPAGALDRTSAACAPTKTASS